MKAKSPLPRYSLGLALILVPITAVRSAQTTPSDRPGAGVTAARADPETIELSPFVVNTDKDAGFAAASALTGGRLASDLRDTPAAYSVITREFIDALGITDLMQAAEWSTASTFNPDTGTSNFFTFSTESSPMPHRAPWPMRRRRNSTRPRRLASIAAGRNITFTIPTTDLG